MGIVNIKTGKEMTRRDVIAGIGALSLVGSANATVRRGLGARLAANFSQGEEAMYKELYEKTLATLNALVDRSLSDTNDLSMITASPKDYVFQMCNSLTTIVATGITRVEQNGFRAVSNVKTIELPNATYVGAWAFMGCSKLETVRLPKATSIVNPFFNMTTLRDVYLDSMPFANRGQYFPWQCTTSSTVFHFADGNYDKDGNPV